MADFSILQGNGLGSPLQQLAALLRSAGPANGQINIPPILDNAVRQMINTTSQLPADEVAKLVDALESGEPSSSSRLGVKTFIIVFAVLRVSEPCWPQLRGLCLLMESVHASEAPVAMSPFASPASDASPLATRKARIGAGMLLLSLNSFCNRQSPEGTRRWMGLLVLELLKDSPKNQTVVELSPENRRRGLGQMVIDEENELLRLIAGSIIRELVSSDSPEDIFWPMDADTAAYADFPKSHYHDSQWVEKFQLYLDDMQTQMNRTDQTSARFAQSLQLGEENYSFGDSQVILVTVHRLLSIFMLVNGLQNGKYIDIPLENVIGIEVGEMERSSHSISKPIRSTVAIIIRLAREVPDTLYVNAVGYSIPFVRLTLDREDTAVDLETRIIRLQEALPTRRISTSQPVDATYQDDRPPQSQLSASADPLNVTYRGQEMPANFERRHTGTDQQTLDDLVATAGRANDIVSKNPSEDIETCFQGGQSPNRRLSTSEDNDGNYERLGNTSPVSLVTLSRSEKRNKANVSVEKPRDDIRPLSQHTNGLSANGLISSAQWQQGVYTIENAPEFQQSLKHGQVQEVDVYSKEQPGNMAAATFLSDDSHDSPYVVPEGPRLTESIISSNENPELPLPGPPPKATAASTSKVSRRMRDREGERLITGGTQEARPQIRKSVGKANVAQLSLAAKTSKPKTSKAKPKKPTRPRGKAEEVQQPIESGPVINCEQADVYAIPDSPTRPSKSHLGLKVSTASSTKPTAKAASSKKKPKRPSKSSALPAKGKKQHHRPVDDSFDLPEELADADRINDGHEHRTSDLEDTHRLSTGKGAKNSTLASRAKAVQPRAINRSPTKLNSTASKKATLGANSSARKCQFAPAALIRPDTRRAAATKANLKIQGISDHDALSPQVATQKTTITNSTDEPDPELLSDHADLMIPSHEPDADQVEHEEHIDDFTVGHRIQIVSKADDATGISEPIDPGNQEATRKLAHNASMVCSGALPIEPSRQLGNIDPSHLLEYSTPGTLHTSVGMSHEESVDVQGANGSGDAEFGKSLIEIQGPTHVSAPSVGLSIETNEYKSVERCMIPIETIFVDVPVERLPREEVSGIVGEENGYRLDEAMELVDLESTGEREPSILAETIPSSPLPVYDSAQSGQASTTASINGHVMSSLNQDTATTETSTKQYEITGQLRPKHNLRTITSSSSRGDHFAVSVNEALSNVAARPPLVVSGAPADNDPLRMKENSADRTSANRLGNQPPNKLSSARRSKSAPSALLPNHDNAKVSKEADGSKEQTTFTKPSKQQAQDTLKTKEAIMIDSEPANELHWVPTTERKIEPQNNEIIELSSGEDESSEYASEVEVPQKASLSNQDVLRGKRKSERVVEGVSKRVKISASRYIDVTTPVQEPMSRQNIKSTIGPANTEEYLHRKTGIIGFGMEEPRNQGVISARKLEMKDLLKQEGLNEFSFQQNPPPKRKHIKEETLGMDQTIRAPSGKRRRTICAASPMSEVAANTVVRSFNPGFADSSQYYGSHGTKIDANGSPLPSTHPPRRISGGLDMHHMMNDLTEAEETNIWLQALADVEDTGLTLNEKMTKLEMNLPALELRSSSSSVKRDLPSSSIGKLLPSSPTAPSRMLRDMTAHREHADGKLVNLHTEAVVHLAHPHDPFVGKDQQRPNNFLQLLRASSTSVKEDATKKTAMNGATAKKPSHRGMTIADRYEDDIDKTLVDEEPSVPSSSGSSTSRSSRSKEKSNPFRPSDDVGGSNALKQWREALRPHQKGTLDALYDVSNRLVQHLMAKEEAIDDVVEGYERDGTRLIDHLAQAHKSDYEEHEVQAREVGEKLVSSFKGVQIELDQARKEIKSSRIQTLAKRLRMEQQSLQSRLEEAISACT